MINNYDITEEEDAKVRHAILGLLSDEAHWQQQQNRQKPRYLSASLSTANHNNHRLECTRCGSVGSHNAVECPFAPRNLLAPSSF